MTANRRQSRAGTYLLLLEAKEPTTVTVGRLGCMSVEQGFYAYVGSAMAGLEPRLARHLRSAKAMHWHIDHLLGVTELVEIWAHRGEERLECRWARLLREALQQPMPGFGASDCHCATHLFYAPERPSFKWFCGLQPGGELVRLQAPEWLSALPPPASR